MSFHCVTREAQEEKLEDGPVTAETRHSLEYFSSRVVRLSETGVIQLAITVQ